MKAAIFAAMVTASIGLASAAPLDPKENSICPILGTCSDIIGVSEECQVSCENLQCVCSDGCVMVVSPDPVSYPGGSCESV